MKVEICEAALDPWVELTAYERSRTDRPGGYGATAVFVGTMRDFNEGDEVRGMILEYYPGMTERQLQRMVAEGAERWELDDVLVVHRVGTLEPGEPIVLVAVWCAHRKEAFEGCRQIMEELKSKAPFWKKEQLEEGCRWVEKNTAGY